MRRRSEWALLCLLFVGCDSSKPMTTPDSVVSPTPESVTPSVVPPNPRVEQPAIARTLSILSWNVESGGNDPETIAAQLSEFAGYDVYCLCEVHSKNFDRYATAVGPGFVAINSKSGRGDRMQILVDGEQFEVLQHKELDRIGDYVMNNGYYPRAHVRTTTRPRIGHGVHRHDEPLG